MSGALGGQTFSFEVQCTGVGNVVSMYAVVLLDGISAEDFAPADFQTAMEFVLRLPPGAVKVAAFSNNPIQVRSRRTGNVYVAYTVEIPESESGNVQTVVDNGDLLAELKKTNPTTYGPVSGATFAVAPTVQSSGDDDSDSSSTGVLIPVLAAVGGVIVAVIVVAIIVAVSKRRAPINDGVQVSRAYPAPVRSGQEFSNDVFDPSALDRKPGQATSAWDSSGHRKSSDHVLVLNNSYDDWGA